MAEERSASLVECVFLKSFIIIMEIFIRKHSNDVCICTNSSGNLSQFVVLLLWRSADCAAQCCARYRYWIAFANNT